MRYSTRYNLVIIADAILCQTYHPSVICDYLLYKATILVDNIPQSFVSGKMLENISVAEITKHATPDDCWIVVNGKVYDLTTFAPNHPGGPDSKISQ